MDIPVRPNERQPMIPKWGIALGAFAILLVLVGIVTLILWLSMTYAPEIEAIRDIFIIIFAAAACSTVIVLVMLLVAVMRLINMLEFELKPILEKTNESMTLIQGTATFVSANVVKPTISVTSYVVAIQRMAGVLLGNPRRNLPND